MAETLRADGAGSGNPARNGLRWYACYTRARHEKQVDRLLQERGFDTFLPLVPRVSQWKDRKKIVEWPLFPSYVFSRFALTDAQRVVATPGVAGLVKTEGRPTPIADDEVENVRRFAHALAGGDVEVEHRPYLAEGEWVEVMDGPFQGIRGVVVEQRNRRRVLIGLKAIGQALEIDIDTRALRPV
ncbi:MAG TPA: UpxY family transcription antiterminator [Longimicrobiales bacterium]|nr:UpxY family transcription antiterminator [Longimicrobiales bacterium]